MAESGTPQDMSFAPNQLRKKLRRANATILEQAESIEELIAAGVTLTEQRDACVRISRLALDELHEDALNENQPRSVDEYLARARVKDAERVAS